MKKIIYSLSIVAILASCDSSDDAPSIPKGAYEDGVIILNEGNFGWGNASVSILTDDEVEYDVFATVNNKPLGDTAQSIAFDDDYAYIVLNASNTIEVVNRWTFESVATINTDLSSPRYMAIVDNKGYVTNWGDGSDQDDDFITIVDLNNYSTSTVSVPFGPEKIVEEDGKLFVAHKGGWQYGNTVTVLDENNLSVIKTIAVGDVPSDMVEEDDNIYVVSSGKASWTGDETGGSIHKINVESLDVTASYAFDNDVHPGYLREDDDTLYLTVGSDVYELSDNGDSFALNNLFSLENVGVASLYGFDVNDGMFYLSDAKDYNSTGEIFILNHQGGVVEQHMVGLLPNGVYFND